MPSSDRYHLTPDPNAVEADSMEVTGLGRARLTVTFGLGTGLFEKNGEDRYAFARDERPRSSTFRDFRTTS